MPQGTSRRSATVPSTGGPDGGRGGGRGGRRGARREVRPGLAPFGVGGTLSAGPVPTAPGPRPQPGESEQSEAPCLPPGLVRSARPLTRASVASRPQGVVGRAGRAAARAPRRGAPSRRSGWRPAGRRLAPSIRSAAVRMSSAEASTSHRPATNVVGTSIPRRDTRTCREVVTARCMYHSIGVVRNSLTARRARSTSGTGSMKPEWVSACPVSGPTGSRRARAESGLPRTRHRAGRVDGDRCAGEARDAEWCEHRGERPPGHAGDREQAGDPVRVQIGELEGGVHAHRPAHHRARSTPAWSITASASSTK